jgi:ArsR family transcriptional regulator, virulence genes transcriptional regulator
MYYLLDLFMTQQRRDLHSLKANAQEAVAFLSLLANDKRLIVLCELAEGGELCVGDLAEAVGLSQSALSQHLCKLRTEGLVQTRREAQTIYYRIAPDPMIKRTLTLLKQLFCP